MSGLVFAVIGQEVVNVILIVAIVAIQERLESLERKPKVKL